MRNHDGMIRRLEFPRKQLEMVSAWITLATLLFIPAGAAGEQGGAIDDPMLAPFAEEFEKCRLSPLELVPKRPEKVTVLGVVIPFQVGKTDGDSPEQRRGRVHLALGASEVLEALLRRRCQALPGLSLLPKKNSEWAWEKDPADEDLGALFPYRNAILYGRVSVLADPRTRDRIVVDAVLSVKDKQTGKYRVYSKTIEGPTSQIPRRVDLVLIPWIAEKTGMGLDRENVIEALRRYPANDAILGQVMLSTALARMPIGEFETPNLRRGQVQKAFKPLLGEAGETPLAWFMYALQLRREDEVRKALKVVVGADPYYADAWQGIAVLDMKRNDWKSAEKNLRNGLQRCPYDGGLLLDLEYVQENLAKKSKSREEALRYTMASYKNVRLAASLMPDSADALNDLGAAYLDRGSFSRAADCFRAAMELDPEMKDAAINCKDALILSGRFEEAVGLLRSHAAILPDNEKLWLELGRLFNSTGRFDSAEKAYRRALGLSFPGKRMEFYSALAESRFRAGNPAEAIGILDEAIKKGRSEDEAVLPYKLRKARYQAMAAGIPDFKAAPDYWRNIAQAENRLDWGHVSAASKALKTAEALLPGGLYAARLKARLQLVNNDAAGFLETCRKIRDAGDPDLSLKAMVAVIEEDKRAKTADGEPKLLVSVIDAIPELEPCDHSEPGLSLFDLPEMSGLDTAMSEYMEKTAASDSPETNARRKHIARMLAQLRATEKIQDNKRTTENGSGG